MISAFLIDDKSEADDKIIANLSTNFFVYHQTETTAVLQGTTEFIRTMVGIRRQELTDKMS